MRKEYLFFGFIQYLHNILFTVLKYYYGLKKATKVRPYLNKPCLKFILHTDVYQIYS